MSKYGMAGNYYERRRQANYLSLEDLPDHRSEYVVDMSDMSGGLNLKELPYKLDTNETPKMQNLWWEDGALCCRDGQSWYISSMVEDGAEGHCCYEGLFHDYAFAHIGTSIYYFNPSMSAEDYRVMYEFVSGIGSDRGAWFTYGDYLMYKNRGNYIRIQYGSASSAHTYYKQSLGAEMTITDKGILDYVDLYQNVRISSTGEVSVIGDAVKKRYTAAKANCIGWYYKDDSGVYKLTSLSEESGVYTWTFKTVGTETTTLFTHSLPSEFCYTPIMYINCSPSTGAGDSYQPENRLSSAKTFWYTPSGGTVSATGTYTAAEAMSQYADVSLNCGYTEDTGLYGFEATVNWYSDAERTTLIGSRAVSYYKVTTGSFITSLPQAMSVGGSLYWSVDVYVASSTYQIPLSGGVTSVDKVIVTDKNSVEHECTEGESGDYTYQVVAPTTASNYTKIKFNFVPIRTTPVTVNTVKITVTKANTDAYDSVMNCNRAITYGGTTDAVIVMGGCPAQPNAYFWNGNNTVMDAGYFPFDHYNLGGGSDEYITQFGKQQGYLIIFKERSIGRASLDSTTLTTDDNARVYLTLDYTAINHTVGCDLPWSVQLCENNLVFANSRTGVYILLDSSSAYENNVYDLSEKIEGTPQRSGLFEDIRGVITDGSSDSICSRVGDMRYWLVVGTHAWVWDYSISAYKDPSWFYFTNLNVVDFFAVGVELYDALKTETGYFGIDGKGRIVQFDQSTNDFGEAIPKLYRTMTMNFGTYDRLKDVPRIDFCLMRRDSTRNIVSVKYGIEMDNSREERIWEEPYPINQEYGIVDTRRPSIKRVHHFYIELSNETADCDMSVSALQVYYKLNGRQRGNGR